MRQFFDMREVVRGAIAMVRLIGGYVGTFLMLIKQMEAAIALLSLSIVLWVWLSRVEARLQASTEAYGRADWGNERRAAQRGGLKSAKGKQNA